MTQCINTMRTTKVEYNTYQDRNRQEDLEEVLDRRPWKLESSKDSKSWKTGREFEEILKRKKLLIKKTVSIYTNIMDSV